MYDDEVGFFATAIGIAVAIIASLFVGGMLLDNHSTHVNCLRTSEATGYETKVQGPKLSPKCYVNLDGKWVPESSWRNFE